MNSGYRLSTALYPTKLGLPPEQPSDDGPWAPLWATTSVIGVGRKRLALG
jgi:hypothetical protein